MSVLIKGMKMPDGCYVCPILNQDDCYCEVKQAKADDIFDRPDWCPLVEVPTPHGRLIEEPTTLSYSGVCKIDPYNYVGLAEYFCGQIKSQQTVIEAEE